jgi:hypothetical protein
MNTTNEEKFPGERGLRPVKSAIALTGKRVVAPGAFAERTKSPRTQALAGTLAVCLMLAASKWGSYIGVAPLFMTDVLLACAVIHFMATTFILKQPLRPPPPSHLWLIGVLALWSFVRFLLGGIPSITAVRDYAPYLYSAVAFLSAYSFSNASEGSRDRTGRLLWWALLFHTGWVCLNVVFPNLRSLTPEIGGIHILHLRTDVDGAVLGITAALALVRWSRGKGNWNFALALLSWALILPLTSRAALLGAITAALLAGGVIRAQRHRSQGQGNRQLLVVFLPIVILTIAALLPQTTVGGRLLTTFGGTPESSVGLSGAGTTQARQDAWAALINYSLSDPERAIFGVGFGPDYMIDSGAGFELLGTSADLEESGVRSPHNYYLGTMARLGLVGLSLVLAISVLGLVLGWRHRRTMAESDLVATAGFATAGLLLPATFGVVLESPFGAIPFFWSLGVLLALPNVSHRLSRRPEGDSTGPFGLK